MDLGKVTSYSKNQIILALSQQKVITYNDTPTLIKFYNLAVSQHTSFEKSVQYNMNEKDYVCLRKKQ